MLFNSAAFPVFLIIVFTAYWLLNGKWRTILILVASYVFYMFSKPEYALIILSVTLISYGAARRIEYAADASKRKAILTVTILLCLGVLFVFKYFAFANASVCALLKIGGVETDGVLLNIVLPVGISFYTFQAIGYTVDVYRGKVPAEKDPVTYAAFVSFFPQLVAGPIERTKNLLPQLKKEQVFDPDRAMCGLILILTGFYKKLVIADGISKYVRTVYGSVHAHEGFALVLATLLFTIQIYCDFSGYSDIAVGTARLFGIDLMRNFSSPYYSGSVKEFWNRWHISLSSWFRDYVYIPLGGSRVGKLKHWRNLMVTFLVSGLWHGADWSFVIWGGIHGLALVIEDLITGRKGTPSRGILLILRRIAVFLFCAFAWIFFVSDNVGDALHVVTHLFTGIGAFPVYLQKGLSDLGLSRSMLVLISALILPLALHDAIELKEGDFPLFLRKKPVWIRWAVCLFIGLAIIYSPAKGAAAEFIYFRF